MKTIIFSLLITFPSLLNAEVTEVHQIQQKLPLKKVFTLPIQTFKPTSKSFPQIQQKIELFTGSQYQSSFTLKSNDPIEEATVLYKIQLPKNTNIHQHSNRLFTQLRRNLRTIPFDCKLKSQFNFFKHIHKVYKEKQHQGPEASARHIKNQYKSFTNVILELKNSTQSLLNLHQNFITYKKESLKIINNKNEIASILPQPILEKANLPHRHFYHNLAVILETNQYNHIFESSKAIALYSANNSNEVYLSLIFQLQARKSILDLGSNIPLPGSSLRDFLISGQNINFLIQPFYESFVPPIPNCKEPKFTLQHGLRDFFDQVIDELTDLNIL